MTYEPMYSAQAQSVRVTKKYILVLLITIVATLQEVSEDKCILYLWFLVKSLSFHSSAAFVFGKSLADICLKM